MAASRRSEAEAKWLEQLAEMRAAVAELKLPPTPIAEVDSLDDWLSGYTDDGLWSFVAENDADGTYRSGSPLDEEEPSEEEDEEGGDGGYGPEWFARRCVEVAARKDLLLSAESFQVQVVEILRTDKADGELQSMLTDLVGFDDLDFVIELLAHRDEVVAAVSAQALHRASGGRLLTRAERDEQLRRRDAEHKSAAIAPTQTREVSYPHVYKAHNAGNSLSHSGRKYALPEGSKRLEFDKYEEYFVPAGKPGTLGPGQKLIRIADLDGLCRRTFQGYKTLNRMQSLVYPVAYQSNENMLICAPTGAVSGSLQGR